MEIEVLDKETVGNDKFMGKCKVSIMEWIANGSFDGDIDLEDKASKVVGRISIAAKFERPNSNALTNFEDRSTKNQVIIVFIIALFYELFGDLYYFYFLWLIVFISCTSSLFVTVSKHRHQPYATTIRYSHRL